MDGYDVVAGAVKDYWKVNYPQDVVAFFQQKYSWDDKWERCEELVECHGSDDYENMTFLYDFCEGQTEVKDVVIVPLCEVTAFYYKRKIENNESEPQTNADSIRAMSDAELAEWIVHKTEGNGFEGYAASVQAWIDWLKQEVQDG